ncbi:undecaprenyldiphospho-muramoylpentapeptide beta-N-acetylglucosaminyltransferase [Chlamydia avium]|uniref:UDP-N-acetylglucosamine--N-acetylmuramyl-(pentapeptide) pyrophosphoryl-undecaprenol N-acetylglucosamine transferase n=1 Tax=Chlamydia avium 10DC88 TaxID=1229831 RepID=W8JMH5_9CHLA|nr:undecaprenyldiphospho-muramoylpentapeptide beta-N-acetylglucosaminyltransferase [Chlamydia avium]AHK63494.1 UDP-N-acetylglucosamine--N-acetylmuramyl- (pentapeptide) pyrophosphoryl-undecaprenol N-acetylglucosamine transferase [Chlamydia avium 10DC88]
MMKEINKVILAAGGSGGHIVPALATREVFCAHGADVLLLGKGLQNHPSLCGYSICYKEIPSGLPSLRQPLSSLKNIYSLYRGYSKATKELKDFSPDLVIGFGSYHSLPILLAALRNKIPIFLHEQNLSPGRVNRLFSHFAKGVGVAFSPVITQFPCPAQEVTLPKRPISPVNPIVDHSVYSPIICVVGGSQGARRLNLQVPGALVAVARDYPNMYVHHLAGFRGDIISIQQVYRRGGIAFCVKPFEDNMLDILLSADLVISRAGATILDEIFWAKVPAILIPYPGACGHQEVNAKFFVYQVGGGSMILDKHLSQEVLEQHIFLALDFEIMKNRQKALQQYYQNKSSKSFYQFICECL